MSTDMPRTFSMNMIKLALVIVCYVLALPFEALVVWSALQVIFLSAAHSAPTASLSHVPLVTLARAHPVPFGVFSALSLAVAFVGAALHRSRKKH